MASELGRRRGVRWLVGLLVILALSWCGYWYAVSRAAQAVIDRITAAVSARGGSLSWTEQRIGGFPASLDLRGSQVKFAYAALPDPDIVFLTAATSCLSVNGLARKSKWTPSGRFFSNASSA